MFYIDLSSKFGEFILFTQRSLFLLEIKYKIKSTSIYTTDFAIYFLFSSLKESSIFLSP